MTVRAPRPRKPTIEARLAAWQMAFHAILAELRTGSDPANIEATFRAAAAQVAAQLVQGADIEGD